MKTLGSKIDNAVDSIGAILFADNDEFPTVWSRLRPDYWMRTKSSKAYADGFWQGIEHGRDRERSDRKRQEIVGRVQALGAAELDSVEAFLRMEPCDRREMVEAER